MKKLFAILMIVMMLMCFMPSAAFADEVEGEQEPLVEPASEHVAVIGENLYATLDEAVEAAEDGGTIELLKDCSTEGLNLSKSITIEGDGHKIDFRKYGIALWEKSLTFKNCTVEMKGIGSTPYTAEWNWMAICARKNASLTLNNTKMTMDGTDAGNAHAIYFCSNNKLNLNNSSLTIENYAQDALEWDGGDGGYNVNIVDSTFTSYNNRSGLTGTFYAVIDNSTVDVINSTGNGSNGSHFDIKNGSVVNFKNNNAHGLSAGKLTIDNSTVNAENNGMCGIIASGKTEIINKANVYVRGNKVEVSPESRWARPGAVTLKGESLISQDSIFEVEGNNGCGIYLWSESAVLNIQSGRVCNNHAGNSLDYIGKGGGIYNEGTCTLSSNVKVYNNHANNAGDDIYNADSLLIYNKETGTNDLKETKASITFGSTGANWKLDGEPDCTDDITGWFDDSENNRWKAHGDDSLHMEEFIPTENGVEGEKALKAAHGKISPEIPPYIPPVTHYYTVTYNDGVEGEVVFNDQINRGLSYYTITPSFNGTPLREGYEFKGWTPAVAERVTADAYYKAVWEKIEEPVQPTEPTKPANPDKPNKPLPGDKELVNDTTNTGTDVPKTGDTGMNALVLNLMLLSISAMAGAVLCIRRKITKK